ncbi:MAG: AAA family ATPase [Clostridiales bacterium]|nr:AAA family ATPase [Clostridiales bacterium]MDY4583613.1 DnaB-like helicase C-terminal domain-containing protein [Candidatus Faecousia sp.]
MTETVNSEAFLAGALLIDGTQVVPAIRGIVTREDFHVEAYGAIFAASLALAEDDETIDPVSIQHRAKRDGVDLSNDLLCELMATVPTAANCVEYANRVAEDARTRRVKELAAQIQEDAASTADELLATLQREFEAIRGSNFQRGLLAPADTLRRFNDHVVEAGEGRCNFIPSGFKKLDQILGGGFIRGGLYILGARPAVGKTSFAVNLADNVAGNVLFVSLEMPPEQVIAKRVSRLTGLPSAKLLSGRVSNSDWVEIARATSALSEMGVFLNSRYDLTVQQIQLLAQTVPELKAVIIDYLGLIQPATRGGSSYENTTAISRELKRLALSLNVPVISLCQLSRSVEKRADKRPMLSDLRDSGAIEQDADAVMFLYRPDIYASGPVDGQPSFVQLDVAKNRHGMTGTDEFSFWMKSSTFKEITQNK